MPSSPGSVPPGSNRPSSISAPGAASVAHPAAAVDADQDPPITREQLTITAAILTALSLAALDSSVVGTAMPTIIG